MPSVKVTTGFHVALMISAITFAQGRSAKSGGERPLLPYRHVRIHLAFLSLALRRGSCRLALRRGSNAVVVPSGCLWRDSWSISAVVIVVVITALVTGSAFPHFRL